MSRKKHEIFTYPPKKEGEIRNLFFSIDYKAMELATAAQTCFDLFGYSTLRDKINAGYDTHAYLGAQIANNLNPLFTQRAHTLDPEDLYHFLVSLKGSKAEWKADDFDTEGDVYKHFRKFAKPTGLGYPGGLGPATFIAYARSPYGVEVDLATAKLLRDVWLQTYPEFVEYFKHLKKNMIDHRNGKVEFEDADGKKRMVNQYMYVTRSGLVRSGCNYTAAANGNALQSPGAEGSGLGWYEISKAIEADPESILYPDEQGYTVKLTDFIHDEYFGEIRDEGPEMNTKRIDEMCRIAEENFQILTPDVKATAEPALMRRCWMKFAEEERDENGFIIPWDDVKSNLEVAKENKWVA